MAETASKEAAAELPAPPAAGGLSMIKLIAILLLLTIVAAGLGGGLGIQLAKQVENAVREKDSAEEKPVVRPSYTGPTHLKALAPIVTNLAEPHDTWIRLEASIIFDDEAIAADEVLAGQISEDILAYLRTVTLSQIEGPSGMQHLREDLVERARIRSEGRVKELVIQTLVVQ
jgi:flagellar FliL protein